MEDNKDKKLIADLLKAFTGIQTELQQMNKTLSIIAAQGKQTGTESAGRPMARGPRSTGFNRSEAPGKRPEEGLEQGFAFPKKKSPSRPKGKLPPKKGGGYPKKPR